MSRDEPLLGHARYHKLAHDTENDRLVAIKFLERGDKVSKYVERELINHRLLRHPHIIKFKEVFLTRFHLGIVLEYADGGDCYDYVVRSGHLSEQTARWIFQQLIVAVHYLHLRGVANRDIKLENTLLVGNPERPLIKLCDFGYAKHEELQSAPDSKVGTPAYLAPEVIMSSRGVAYDAKVADVWSCGVLLYVMLCGAYPFERAEDRDDPPNKRLAKTIQRIIKVDYYYPDDLQLSHECKHLLSRILVANPEDRASIGEIMGHPWFTTNLPPGVSDMNKKLKPPDCSQSEEDVRAIVRSAQNLEPGDQGGPEQQIDQLMAAARPI